MVPVRDIARVAKDGSPTLLYGVGRLFGLGAAERQALFGGGGVPGWALLAVGLTAGAVIGVAAHRRWPQHAERLIGR